GLTLEDARTLSFADAVEVYNHTCAVQADRPDGTYLLDQMLLDGIHLNAIATDDAHFRDEVNSNADAFGGWVMVKSETLAPEAILAALKRGDFYASQGPDLRQIRLADGLLEIESSPVERITVLSPRARSRTISGKSMTSARLDVSSFTGDWARVVVVDAAGRRAWSNPIRLPG
ncbi:MAG: phosphotransferase, partial [Tabrizicola sp.]